MLEKAIEILKMPRLGILEQVKDLSIEQLNKIPAGFNNNIIWNLGHIIAAQQGVCYRRAGVETVVSADFMNTYGGGSKPDNFLGEDQLRLIKELYTSTLDQLIVDYNRNLFANYTAWTTRYGVNLTSIDDVLQFLPFHEGMHVGTIMAMKRLVLAP
ncbi:MAG: DinB family protein [Mucilaginibacter sp.]